MPKSYTSNEQTRIPELYERDNPEVVVVVDEHDNATGIIDKIRAHQNGGTLHRAFSVFIRDTRGRLLLQRRAFCKYHFGGLWTNTCCGHAVPDEDLELTVSIRLWQEMGICTELRETGVFSYSATDSASRLTEREIDHVYEGVFEGRPSPNPKEVAEWRWVIEEELLYELSTSPEQFTPWFVLALQKATRRT